MMPNWDKSVGVLAEIEFAIKYKKRIRYFVVDTLAEYSRKNINLIGVE
jgi:hypothetical protein